MTAGRSGAGGAGVGFARRCVGQRRARRPCGDFSPQGGRLGQAGPGGKGWEARPGLWRLRAVR